jgi:hypothetical protein
MTSEFYVQEIRIISSIKAQGEAVQPWWVKTTLAQMKIQSE